MKAQILKYRDGLRSSFWFLTSLMADGAVVLAFANVALDEAVTDEWLQVLGWAYTGGAEGASLVLGSIAGSMITIAGVVFSMTLVSLSLASSHFGPRLQRISHGRVIWAEAHARSASHRGQHYSQPGSFWSRSIALIGR